jgi:glutathione S-transferase
VSAGAEITLMLTRTFAAPREAVFDAWVDPEVLKRWWAALEGWTTPEAVTDPRVGGRYRLAMGDPETGAVHAVAGEYVELRRPERIAYTWTWEGEPDEMRGSEDTLVTVDFIEEGGGTKVVVVHSGFGGDGARDLHAEGWTGCLDNLTRRVFPGSRPEGNAA